MSEEIVDANNVHGEHEQQAENKVQEILDVSEILHLQSANTNLEKTDDIEQDLGNMCAFDIHPLDPQRMMGKAKEKYLFELTTDNTKKLLTELFKLEIIEDQVDGDSLKLPAPVFIVPREKSIPKPKEPTKWERFAKEKGIGKHKKERMIFDEETGKYMPRYGYKRSQDEKNAWLMVEKPGEDFKGSEDPFQARAEAKKKKIAEQRDREKKNKEKNEKSQLPYSVSLTNTRPSKPGKPSFRDTKHIKEAVSIAAGSTASLGRFDTHRKNEPKPSGRKQQRNPVTEVNTEKEKEKNIDVLNKMFGSQSRKELNMRKAVKVVNLEKEKQNRERKNPTAGKGIKRKTLQDASKPRLGQKSNKRRKTQN
eukprot:c9738_g1_i1.p1 GENE.c9738_g1_i1~~c9738_g1_i1.p1  ORF type:complete len:372 (+),score=164.47 c9738_g1_i1:23-1117(+)